MIRDYIFFFIFVHAPQYGQRIGSKVSRLPLL